MKKLIFVLGFLFSTTAILSQPTSLTIDNNNCYRVFAKAIAKTTSCGGAITSPSWIAIGPGGSASVAPLGSSAYVWDEVLIYIDPFTTSCIPNLNINDATHTQRPGGSCSVLPTSISGVSITCNKGCSTGTTLGTTWTSPIDVLVF